MSTIQVKDRQFETSIPQEEIEATITRLATQISADLHGKDPLFLVLLNGAFMFAADLLKHISTPCRVSFVKLASYQGTTTTGTAKQLIGLNESIAGQTIVIVEDIVETGITMQSMLDTLAPLQPKEVRIATLFHKPQAMQKNIRLHYVGMELPKKFIVGYGLDYDGYGRNLPDIYEVK